MEEKITKEELAGALERRGHYNAADLATRYFADILEYREPEWKPGDVVRDANGVVWFRYTTDGQWLRPGLGGTFDDSMPRRPLRMWTPKER